MSNKLARFFLLNLIGVAGVIVAGLHGWITYLWESDLTYLVTTIFIVHAIGLVCAGLEAWKHVDFITDTLVILGLIGTVAGIIIALSGVVPSSVGDVSSIAPMVAKLIVGLKVAAHTTLVGMIGYLWLGTNRHLLS